MLPVAKWVLWVFGAQAISPLPWVNIMVGAKQKKSAQPVDVLPHLSVHRSERTGQSLGITPQTIANVQAEQGHCIFTKGQTNKHLPKTNFCLLLSGGAFIRNSQTNAVDT